MVLYLTVYHFLYIICYILASSYGFFIYYTENVVCILSILYNLLHRVQHWAFFFVV